MNVVLMFGSSFVSFQGAQAKMNIVDYVMRKNVTCTEVKEVNKRRKTMPFVKENKAAEVKEAGQCFSSLDIQQ